MRFYGPIGFVETVETTPGVWEDRYHEHNYSGEVPRLSSRWSSTPDSTNGELAISDQISIIADPFARDHFHSIRYVQYMGTKWKVTNVDATKYPRLLLTLGGRWNG